MYGLLISLAIFLSFLIVERLATKRNKNTDVLWNGGFWTILGGVAGARIYHVLNFPNLYFSDPVKILEIWNGGLGILGAIVGGGLATIIYLRLRKESVPEWLDIVCTTLPLAQAAGRWGNFFNQELYGKATNLPWGIYITSAGQKFHPLFLYESISNLILFLLLMKLGNKKLKPGIVALLYLFGYSTIRFFLEFLRIGPWTIFGLNVAQGVSILLMLVSYIFLVRINKNA